MHSHAGGSLGGELAVENNDDPSVVRRDNGLLEQEVLHLLFHVKVYGTLGRKESRLAASFVAPQIWPQRNQTTRRVCCWLVQDH